MELVEVAIQNNIDLKIKYLISRATQDIEEYIEKQFETSSIIGKEGSYKTFSDWVKYVTDNFRQLPDQIDTKTNEIKEIIEEMKSEAEANDARRDEINKETLEKVIEDISKDQQEKFEETKASMERTLREANLEVDTRFKERLDNLKDSLDIKQQNMEIEITESKKSILSVQQKVIDINSFKLKEVSDTAKEANELSKKYAGDAVKMIDNKFEAYEK